MTDLLLMFAKVLSNDDIIKMISEAIDKYKLDPSEENMKGVEMGCILMTSKRVVQENGIEHALATLDRNKRIAERFNDKS